LLSFLNTEWNPLFLELRPDWTVLAFTASIGVLTCILFGLYPAIRATGTAPVAAMKSAGRGLTASREKFGIRRVLVVSQVALSLVLLVGALLFVRSLRNLLTLDAGFREDGLLITGVDISRLNYSTERRAALYADLMERLRATPGVQDAASTQIVQVSGNSSNGLIEILGQPAKNPLLPWFNRVSDNYFRTMGTPLLAGRDFNDRDTAASPEVAIVNEMFSAKFLGGKNPIGKEFRTLHGPGEPQHLFRIVGLVKNSKYRKLRDDFVPIVFVAASQNKEPDVGQWFVVRSNAPLGSLLPQLKRSVLGVSPGISLLFQVFKTQVRESLLRERLMAALSGFFGFLAAALAIVGLYGVISYMVARRRNEIGIRIALGADRANVLRLVLKEAGLLLLAGLVIGTGLSIAAARAATSLLSGLQPYDPVTIALAVALLAAVALIASGIPALRAARLNPMAALREE
jgi:putative ABC transport system permease protein